MLFQHKQQAKVEQRSMQLMQTTIQDIIPLGMEAIDNVS